jgi:hypothetical protein
MAVFLNDFLTVMFDVILARQGHDQDFVGDGSWPCSVRHRVIRTMPGVPR